ncbi:phage integrase SAM-like domain-containing protein [Elizabethkingia meningoseptica]|uniref:phage integrase SAM-like domain-containing protein n=1 Tax=Elizabethkingia meningoseptica TaxID=238 RepID=UPI0030190721
MTIKFTISGKTGLKYINVNLKTDSLNLKFFTTFRIYYEEWDIEKNRPKNIYLKKFKRLNNKLDYLKKEIALYVNQRQKQNKEINTKSLSRIIRKIALENNYIEPENSLLSIIKNYINEREDFISYSTYKRYKVFHNLIQRYEGYIMKSLFLEDINMDFVKKFMIFGKEENYSENTIYRTIHFIKTILNFIERKGITTSVRQLDIKREKQHKEIVSLSEKEIYKISVTDLPDDLKSARDWLVISCYTGQRFSDFMNFSTEKLLYINEKLCIRFIQRKTKKEIILPLHPIVIDIINRNDNKFPIPIDIATYNAQIKLIAKIAEINHTLSARIRLEHRAKSFMIEKWQTMTSHIGRRSFATNFYGKIPTPLLLHATGHSPEQMFLEYINKADNEHIVSLSNYFHRTYQSFY